MKQMFIRLAGIALAAWLVAACSSGPDVAVIGKALPDLGGGKDLKISDVEEVEQDVAVGTDDVVAPPDVQPEDIAIVPDVPVVVDVPPVVDVPSKPDIAPDVPAKPDVVVKPDVGPDPCVKAFTDFEAAKAKALACSTPFDCIEPVKSSIGCDCQIRVSDQSFDYQAMSDVDANFAKLGCKISCPPGPCPDFTQEVGVCKNAKCQTINAPCKDLETYATAAIAEGIKCTADTDCNFKASVTLGCGCPAYMNGNTIGPAKPLFLYVTMLENAYKAKACTSTTACDCFDPQSAKCIDGLCVGQP